jgi:hypothetical protein
LNVLPDRTDKEKITPRIDAADALKNDAYVHKRFFLLNTRDDIAPIKYSAILPKKK